MAMLPFQAAWCRGAAPDLSSISLGLHPWVSRCRHFLKSPCFVARVSLPWAGRLALLPAHTHRMEEYTCIYIYIQMNTDICNVYTFRQR